MTLPDLWPIFASVFAPMLVVVAGMMRYLHTDNLKTRDRVDKSSKETRDLINKNRDLIERTTKENRDLIEESRKENRDLIDKNRELIEKNHRELTASLGEVRERLAHIEGHLRIPPPPADDDTAAEAA